MAIKLSEINKPQSAAIDTQYGVVKVTYNPSAYTAEIELLIAEAEQRPAQALVDITRRLVLEWDILDDEGNPLPVAQETLMKLPLNLLAEILRGLTDAMKPNPTS